MFEGPLRTKSISSLISAIDIGHAYARWR